MVLAGNGGGVVTPPFFEVGPKAYAYGPEVVQLARRAGELSVELRVQVLLTPQSVDIAPIAAAVPDVLVFAQHMDPLVPGRGVGSILPEAVRAAGAVGVLLNHSERRLDRSDLARTMERARSVGLATMVCADDVAEAVSIAGLRPDVLIVEDPGLIAVGSSAPGSRENVAAVNAAIWRVDPAIRVLHGAGIGDAQDVYDVIAAGAQGTGSSSAIFTAPTPGLMLEQMMRAVREAWDATHSTRGTDR